MTSKGIPRTCIVLPISKDGGSVAKLHRDLGPQHRHTASPLHFAFVEVAAHFQLVILDLEEARPGAGHVVRRIPAQIADL